MELQHREDIYACDFIFQWNSHQYHIKIASTFHRYPITEILIIKVLKSAYCDTMKNFPNLKKLICLINVEILKYFVTVMQSDYYKS